MTVDLAPPSSVPQAVWVRRLFDHVIDLSEACDRPLVVVVDVETALIDQRIAMTHALRWYDHARGTAFAAEIPVATSGAAPVTIDELLGRLPMPGEHRAAAADFFREHLWHPETVIAAHAPFEQTMDAVRLLHFHQLAHVALTSARSERLRWETLHALDALARLYDTELRYDLLFMNEFGSPDTSARSKAIALERLESADYVVAAVVDAIEPQSPRGEDADARRPPWFTPARGEVAGRGLEVAS